MGTFTCGIPNLAVMLWMNSRKNGQITTLIVDLVNWFTCSGFSSFDSTLNLRTYVTSILPKASLVLGAPIKTSMVAGTVKLAFDMRGFPNLLLPCTETCFVEDLELSRSKRAVVSLRYSLSTSRILRKRM